MSSAKFHFMRLPERMLEANRAPTAIDEFYAKAIMDKLISDKDQKLLERFVEHGGLSDDELSRLEVKLNVPRDLVKHDLSERAAKEEHVRKYKALVERQQLE